VPPPEPAETDSDGDAIEAAPFDEVVLRLVYEMTLERVRHRALLAYLEKHVGLEFAEYERLFHSIADRDGEALFARLMMNKEDFDEYFEAWAAEDRKRYVTQGRKPASRRSRTAKTQ
jgi:hypothetical protein